MADIGDTLFHDRDQAVPAGDDTRVIALFDQKTDDCIDSVRAMIFKRTRNHVWFSLTECPRRRCGERAENL